MIVQRSLWDEFVLLSSTDDSSAVSAVRCGKENQHLLLKGQFGEPILLLATHPRTSPRADIKLKHVHVSFEKRFEVRLEQAEASVGTFCKFTCDPGSPHLHKYFVELMAATARAQADTLSQGEVDEAVGVLLELFRKLALPARRSVAGLWGELLIIHLAANTEAFVNAWHSTVLDGFDFAFPDLRIEVKTTERPTREHEFSLRQVRGGESTDCVASVVLSRSSSGQSALSLTRLIADRVGDELQAKLWRLVLETLGDDAEGADEHLFDVKAAADSLVFLPAASIPAPTVDSGIASLITDVRFRANITSLCAGSTMARSSVLSQK